MANWLPKGLRDSFDDENLQAEADALIGRVKEAGAGGEMARLSR
jgi:hypothetical protein